MATTQIWPIWEIFGATVSTPLDRSGPNWHSRVYPRLRLPTEFHLDRLKGEKFLNFVIFLTLSSYDGSAQRWKDKVDCWTHVHIYEHSHVQRSFPYSIFQRINGEVTFTNVVIQKRDGQKKTRNKKQGNRRYQILHPRCAIPPPSRLRPKFSEYCLLLSVLLNDPFCYMTLLAIEWSLLQLTRAATLQRRLRCFWIARTTPENCPFPLGDRVPHLTRGTQCPPKSSPQMASRSVQPFLYVS